MEELFDFNILDDCFKKAPCTQFSCTSLVSKVGSFRNATSCYASEWVKVTPKRFPRIKSGIMTVTWLLPTLFNHSIKYSRGKKDAHAFAQLMKHVKYIEQQHNTVIVVRVEFNWPRVTALPKQKSYWIAFPSLFLGTSTYSIHSQGSTCYLQKSSSAAGVCGRKPDGRLLLTFKVTSNLCNSTYLE